MAELREAANMFDGPTRGVPQDARMFAALHEAANMSGNSMPACGRASRGGEHLRRGGRTAQAGEHVQRANAPAIKTCQLTSNVRWSESA